MSNTFLTPTMIVRDAAIILSNNLVAAQLVNRNHEDEFEKKIGDTVAVKVPPVQTARDFIDDSLSTTANNITETSVDLKLTEQPYVRNDLSSAEKTLELDDFNQLVTEPAVLGIRDQIDAHIINVGAAGFAPNLVGTDGTSPSSKAHIVAGRKALMDNKCPNNLRRAIISTTVTASFLQLAEFTDVDFGSENPPALREGALTRKYGIDWWEDQNVGSIPIGTDIAGSVLTDGTPVLGASTLHLDAFTATTGTVIRGTRFTVAGDTTVYTISADSAIASNEGDMAITPVVTQDLVDAGTDTAVTFKTAATENIVFHRDALAAAIVPPVALAVNSAVQIFNGIGIRVTMSSSTTSLSDVIVFDCYLGAQVIQVDGGIVLQG